MARAYSLKEIGTILVQRRWTVLAPLALGVALTPLLARAVPERYRSEALIVVVPQRVPESYVKPTVQESVADRLPAITEEILSRFRLEQIIEEMDLYRAERARWAMEDVVARMRLDIKTTAVGREVNSFRISYLSDAPERARLVTERLAGLYRDQNTESRSTQADQTSGFLNAQLEEAKKRLIEQEKRLEDYRKTHSGQLPSQLQGNLQAIQNANLQLQSINEATNRAQERRLLIERQLADTLATPVAAPAPVIVTNPEAAAPLSAARQLEIAEARLPLLLQRNTPDHPDVVSMQRLIADLKERAAAEKQTVAADGTAAVVVAPPTPEELAQQKRIQGLRAELEVVDFQLAANRTDQERLQQTINEYQAKVDAVPTRESELVELTRDYSTMQAAYTNLLMKREDSTVAANLERQRIGEEFKLVDAASRPERPDNQRIRTLVMLSGPIGGLLLGLALVGLLEYRDSSYRSADEVLTSLEIPVLASIPVMASARERRHASRRRWTIDAVGTLGLVAAAAVIAWWRFGS